MKERIVSLAVSQLQLFPNDIYKQVLAEMKKKHENFVPLTQQQASKLVSSKRKELTGGDIFRTLELPFVSSVSFVSQF